MNKTKELVNNALIMTIALFLSIITIEIPILINLSSPIFLLYCKKTSIRFSILSYLCFTLLGFLLKGMNLFFAPIVLFDYLYVSLLILFIHHLKTIHWKTIILTYYLVSYYFTVIYLFIFFNLKGPFLNMLVTLLQENILLFLIQILNLTVPLIIAFIFIYLLTLRVNKIILTLEKIIP